MERNSKVDMAYSLYNYLVSSEGTMCVPLDESFYDVSQVHSYFNSEKKDEDYQDKYETISSILDFYSELWGSIEENDYSIGRVKDKRKSMPITLEQMNDMIVDTLSGSLNPPLRLINKISDEGFFKISKLLSQVRVVLRRERKKVFVGRAQQIDSQCMRWLSKQPGFTVGQKAGMSQQILAVVREETSDILENRVLKAFLKLCVIECDSYIHEFKGRFPFNERLDSVRRLGSLAKAALSLSVFKEIPDLRSTVKPNYVLQKNPLYNLVWNYYQELLFKTKLVEKIWINRHKVIRELLCALTLSLCHKKYCQKSSFRHELWLEKYISDSGLFFGESDWRYFDYSNSNGDPNLLEFYNEDASHGFLYKVEVSKEKNIYVKNRLSFAFIPYGTNLDYRFSNLANILVYDENLREGIGLKAGSSFVLNAYDQIKKELKIR